PARRSPDLGTTRASGSRPTVRSTRRAEVAVGSSRKARRRRSDGPFRGSKGLSQEAVLDAPLHDLAALGDAPAVLHEATDEGQVRREAEQQERRAFGELRSEASEQVEHFVFGQRFAREQHAMADASLAFARLEAEEA